jgi:hypothetical protein
VVSLISVKSLAGKAVSHIAHLVLSLAIIAATVAVLGALSYVRSVQLRHRAEKLLHEFASLPLGTRSGQRATELAKRFRAVEQCTTTGCRYHFKISFGMQDGGLTFLLRRTEWDYFGLRPWRVDGGIEVQGNDVISVEFDTLIARGRGWLYDDGLVHGNEWAWWLYVVSASPHRLDNGRDIAVIKPAFDTPGGGEALRVSLSPFASQKARVAAFDVNLRCATSRLSCSELCQLAPSAWSRYSAQQKASGFGVEEPASCRSR